MSKRRMFELTELRPRYPSAYRGLLNNGEHTTLAVHSGGRRVMSVLTGVDRRANRLSGQNQGYFALFEGEDNPQAARLLFQGVAGFQRGQGIERAVGPIAPDGSALGMGVMTMGFELPPEPLNPRNPDYCDPLLRSAGLAPWRDWLGFELDMEALASKRYIEAARWAMARHGVCVDKLELRRGKPAYERMYLALEAGVWLTLGEFAAQLDLTRPSVDPRFLLLASVRGRPAGMILALRGPGGVPRVATLHVTGAHRGSPVALCLFGQLIERARAGGVRRMTASVIDAENQASIACVRGAGGKMCRAWRQYQLKIDKN